MRMILSAVALLAITPPATAASLLNGVAAGDVGQTKATLWARGNVPGQLTFEVSTFADFSSLAFSSNVAVGSDRTPSHQSVGGLSAATRYFYRATDAGGDFSMGTFLTAAASGRNGLRFGVSGDARGDAMPYPSISNVPGRDLNFFVHLGDTIYADIPSPALPGVGQATTLAEFRAKHEEQLTPRSGLNTLVDLRQSTALFAQIDDHEVTNDFAGAAPISSDARFAPFGAPGDLINTSTLYQNGLQAFQDYQPIENRVYSGTGEARFDGRPDLYRKQSYGLDAVMITVDARSFRDEGIDDSNPAATLAAAFTPGRTLLGKTQLDRLKQDLVDAQVAGVTWKFITLPEPTQNLGPLLSSDRYEGYAAERSELLAFIDKRGIRNVVFIAADVHGTTVNNLTYQAINEANPQLSFLGAQLAGDVLEVTTGAVAFPRPFGPSLARLAMSIGQISPLELAFYNSLPIAPDLDDTLNDRDDFIKMLINTQLASVPPGNPYSLLGLDDLGRDFKLVSGDWFMGHHFGWSEFEIHPLTQRLTVRTWGVNFEQVNAALGNPALLAALTPRVIGEFNVAAEIPEPATWALLIIGFGLSGTAMRRRRIAVAARI